MRAVENVVTTSVRRAIKYAEKHYLVESINARRCVTMVPVTLAQRRHQSNAGTWIVFKIVRTLSFVDRTISSRFSCGKTVINVACGREKKTKPPKCMQPCR